MDRQNAEMIALKALGFLADSPDALEKFMRLSGVDLTTIQASAEDRDFLSAVLEFLMADEALLVRFCEATRTEPKAVKLANYEFSGI